MVACHYAMVEAGYKDRYWGKPEREMLSEADKIPVVMIGEPVDPDGKGAASNGAIYLKCPPVGDTRLVWARASVAWSHDAATCRGNGVADADGTPKCASSSATGC